MSGSTEATIPDTTVTADRVRAPDDTVRLRIDGKDYLGWLGITLLRSIEQVPSTVALTCIDHWSGQDQPWPILPFATVELRFGEDVVLTGYVVRVAPSLTADTRSIRVECASKTVDLVDCSVGEAAGEFRGSALDAVARALAAPFGVEVVADADLGAPIDLAGTEREGTVFDALEQLARMRGVLLTDDGAGRLRITRAGSAKAGGSLVQGENVLEAQAVLDGSHRFSVYTVLGQRGSASAWDQIDPAEGEPEPSGGGAVVGAQGMARDTGVPRYRPKTIMAEKAAGGGEAQARALWQARYNAGKARRCTVRVAGWRAADGTLWQSNTLVQATLGAMQMDGEMLIASVSYELSADQRTTVLEIGPVEGFTPEPLAAAPAAAPRRGRVAQPAGTGGGLWGEVVPIQ